MKNYKYNQEQRERKHWKNKQYFKFLSVPKQKEGILLMQERKIFFELNCPFFTLG
jgi:hypothetical protein